MRFGVRWPSTAFSMNRSGCARLGFRRHLEAGCARFVRAAGPAPRQDRRGDETGGGFPGRETLSDGRSAICFGSLTGLICDRMGSWRRPRNSPGQTFLNRLTLFVVSPNTVPATNRQRSNGWRPSVWERHRGREKCSGRRLWPVNPPFRNTVFSTPAFPIQGPVFTV